MTVQLLLQAVFTYGTPYVYKVYILSRWGSTEYFKGEVSPNNNVDWVSEKQF